MISGLVRLQPYEKQNSLKKTFNPILELKLSSANILYQTLFYTKIKPKTCFHND